MAGSKEKTLDIQTPQTQVVDFSVVTSVRFAKRHSQRKDISPVVVINSCKQIKLIYVKGVSLPQICLERLQNFSKTWLDLGACPKVV